MARFNQRVVALGAGVLLSGCYTGANEFGAQPGDHTMSAGGGATEGDDGDSDGPNADSGGSPSSCETLSVGESPLRRLTRDEYDNTVRDLLGDVTRPAKHMFSSDEYVGGFAANGLAPLSKTQLDEYVSATETLAATFIATGAGEIVDCSMEQSACASEFVTRFGRRAYRRPITDQERSEFLAVYEDARERWDGETGIRLVVESMLLSPHFLYHVEMVPDDAAPSDVVALGAFERARRTSYFLWASMPDDELFDAAQAGDLDSAEGLEAQIRRMLDDDRAADTIASFTAQWMHLEGIDEKVKDQELFPQWDSALSESMERESVAFANEVIRHDDGLLSTLLTASWTMADASIAELYGAAPPDEDFGRIELMPTQRSGILTQAGFLTNNAHAAENSWVYRGKFVRENLMCQILPAPPPGVEGNEANDSGRLENPECSGCHLLMDPIGMAFDDYDPLGQFTDAGQAGTISSSSIGDFDDIVDMAGQLAQSPEVQQCMAIQWFRYATRRMPSSDDECGLDEIQASFAESGHDLRELIVTIAMSDALGHIKVAP